MDGGSTWDAGENIKIAFNAVDGDGAGLWYVWFIDNVTVSSSKGSFSFNGNELENVSYSENTSSKSNASHAKDGKVYPILTADKAAKAAPVVIGTNVYRDGEMIAFVPVPDTFLLDMNLEPGYYDYCVTKVYSADEGLHTWTSCEDGTCVLDVLVPEDCIAPVNLTAEDLLGDGYTATLNWEAYIVTISEWLQYDIDVQGFGGIGAEAADYSLIWASKFVPEDLTVYSPGFVTKVAVSQLAPVGDFVTEVRIMSGDGTNVLYAQDVTGTLIEGWQEIVLDEAVPFDNTENLWIGMYAERPGGTFNEPTSTSAEVFTDRYDYFAYNGAAWTQISTEYGFVDQAWMLRGFVSTNPNGKSVALGTGDYENTEYTDYSNAERVPTGLGMIEAEFAGQPFPYEAQTKEFLSFNVYRDGELIAEDVMETTYADEVGVAGEFCYEVTAVYSVCGESAPSNEACVFVAVGVNDVENNISVYPNPANDFVMVEASQDIRSIEITNYMGQVVNSVKAVEMTQYRINTSSLSAGIYFVEVETTAGIEKVRIVISK